MCINHQSDAKKERGKICLCSSSSRNIYNGYSKIWNEVDLSKQLYINGKKAFDYILYNKIEKTLGVKTRKTFRTREERIHN